MYAVSGAPRAALAASIAPRGAAARWALRPISVAFSAKGGGAEPAKQHKLVLYSKPGCCLCDGLKEKLDAALSLAGPHSLHSVDLQVRDISSNIEWERLYQYEIPVLARVLPDGTEEYCRFILDNKSHLIQKFETLPRLSPRLRVELIQKKIASAFEQ